MSLITKYNFFQYTAGTFSQGKEPDRPPDHESEYGSKTWFERDCVVRTSSFWGEFGKVNWLLEGWTKGKTTTGFCYWKSLRWKRVGKGTRKNMIFKIARAYGLEYRGINTAVLKLDGKNGILRITRTPLDSNVKRRGNYKNILLSKKKPEKLHRLECFIDENLPENILWKKITEEIYNFILKTFSNTEDEIDYSNYGQKLFINLADRIGLKEQFIRESCLELNI